MSHSTFVWLIFSGLVLIPGTAMAVRSFLQNRAEEMASSRDYVGREHDGDLFRQRPDYDKEHH